MALDGKTIKEEIPEKETYETTNSRHKSKVKDNCKTPDSPEGARAVAPRSPISPHHTNLLSSLSKTNRNGSLSPIVNENSNITPPPSTPGLTPIISHSLHSQDTSRALIKIRRFLGALVQFGQDSCHDNGDKVRALVLSLASGGLTAEEFKVALQEATNFPVRPNVLPFLRSHIPILQREISNLARNSSQTTLQYVRANETFVIELNHNLTESSDIFLPIDGGSIALNNGSHSLLPLNNGTSQNFLKRRGSETFIENNNAHEWSDLIPTKRQFNPMMAGSSAQHLYSTHSQFMDYQNGPHSHTDGSYLNQDKQTNNPREDVRAMSSDSYRKDRQPSGEEEWKNIHTMLSCISAMVEKTKRAITILQQRSSDIPTSYQDSTLADIKRQTEEKVAEFRRNAEEAVTQVKRQAVIEIQRAVVTAENRAVEIMTQERLKMEKFFSELNKSSNETLMERNSQSPVVPGSQNVCWNCGRKANETCSGCNFARYCGAFCQHKDWEQHHQVCGTTRIDTVASKTPLSNSIKPPIRSSPPQQPNQQQQQQHATIANGIPCGIK